jgi:PAS domain-containing protein
MQKTNFKAQFTNAADACALAQSIVDTVREPVVVLDKGLRVIAASRSFYSAFQVSPEETQGRLLYALGDGQWDIPKLRVLLDKIIPEHGLIEDYEVEHEFPKLGHRTMRLNARCSTRVAPTRPFYSESRMSPSGACWSAKRTSY